MRCALTGLLIAALAGVAEAEPIEGDKVEEAAA